MSRTKLPLATLPAAALLVMTGCASAPTSPETATTTSQPEQAVTPSDLAETKAIADRADPLMRARIWSEAYNEDPTRLDTALEFSLALRAIGSNERAAEIASNTSILHSDSYPLMMVLGRSLTSLSKFPPAANAFAEAIRIDPSRADAYAALGLVYDRAERPDLAQPAYIQALEIDPTRSGTLSNYGLSLAMTGHIDRAEEMLRKAVTLPDSDQRIEQNLALVLGLQGKFDDMREASGAAPTRTVESNTDLLRQMLGMDSSSTTGTDPAAFIEDSPTADDAPIASPTILVEDGSVDEIEAIIAAVPASPETLPTAETEAIETATATRPALRGSLSE
ncbi:MAG: tetratricopeptide repeat protein [Hyphomonadaceae bacterium]